MGRGSSSCESDCPRAGAGSSPKLGAPVGIEVLSCVHLLKMVCRAKCCSVLPCLTANDLSCYVPVLSSILLFLPPVPHPPCPYLPFSFAFFQLGPNCFVLLCSSFFPALPSSPYVFWFVLGSRRPRPMPYTSGFLCAFRPASANPPEKQCD